MKTHKTGATHRSSLSWSRLLAITAVALLAVTMLAPSAQAKPVRGTTTITGTASINSGAAYSSSPTVTINSAITGATQMQFRNAGGAWSAWETYNAGKTWVFPAGDGVKTVEMQYKNKSVTSGVKSDSITVDSAAPATTNSYDGLPATIVAVTLASADTLSGVATTEYRIDGGAWKTGSSVVLMVKVPHKRAGFAAGSHLIDYRSTDAAGNVEPTQSFTVLLGL